MAQIRLDLQGLTRDFSLLIAAAETEDEIGSVLRIHLIFEKVLEVYLNSCIVGDAVRYVKMPRDFGAKLGLAVAYGIPVPIAAVIHQLNVMRNKLAHPKGGSSIQQGDIEQLARMVNGLVAIDPSFKPVERRYLELPQARPGVQSRYGEQGLRVDFIISGMSAFYTTTEWLLRDIEARYS